MSEHNIQKTQKQSFIFGFVAGVAIVSVIGLVIMMSTGFHNMGMEEDGGATVANTVETGNSVQTQNSSGSMQEVLKEITPTGTPDYGKKAGISYDKVEQSLSVLRGFDQSITLSASQQKRYVKVGTSPLTACEFCCGIKEGGFAKASGQTACGCSHNIAFSGLTKWLIKNTSYTNDQIVAEIGQWKILFFPKGAVEKEIKKRGITPSGGEIPSMKGGC